MWVAWMLAVGMSVAALPAAGVELHHDASAFPALVHLLQCRAGVTPCSRAAFTAWSNDALRWTRGDDAQLERVRAVTARYAIDATFRDDPGAALGLPLNHPSGWSAQDKIRVASWDASSPAELQAHLARIMKPADAATYASVVAYFWPRYRDAVAPLLRPLEARAHELDGLVRSRSVAEVLRGALAFYAPGLSSVLRIRVHLVPRPRQEHEEDLPSASSMATVVENHAVVEVDPRTLAVDDVDVVLHEVFHALHEQRSAEQHGALLRAFLESGDPEAAGLYAIMDEVLAAALGNGLVLEAVKGTAAAEKAWARERGLYNEFFIDRAGSRLIRPLQAWMKGGGVLGPEFVPVYLREVRAALGDRVDAVALHMKMRNIIPATGAEMAAGLALAESFRGIHTEVDRAGSRLTAERYAHLGAIMVARPENLPRLEAHATLVSRATLDAARAGMKGARAVVVGEKRGALAHTYVVVCEDDAACADAWKAVLDRDHRFTGLGVRLAR